MSELNMECPNSPSMAKCAYCNGFFVKNDEGGLSAMRVHLEKCPDHPMSRLKNDNKVLRDALVNIIGTDDLQKLYVIKTHGYSKDTHAAIMALIETHPGGRKEASAAVRQYKSNESSWAEVKAPKEERETLRDKFAMRALRGDWSAQGFDCGYFHTDIGDDNLRKRADLYYRMADAMLIARKEKEST